MVSRSHVLFLFFYNISSSKRECRKDSLRKRVDLEGQPHYSRDELNIMNSSTLLHNSIIY